MKAMLWVAAVLTIGAPVMAQPPGQLPPRPAAAQPGESLTDADIEKLREGLRADKRQTTAETLQLTGAEAAKFWPVYDRYIADLTRINDAKYTLIQEYSENFGRYSDKQATDFIRRWLDVDIKASQLRSRYVPIVGKVLPGIKAASFFQIDRRLAMLVNLGLASQLPILQSQGDQVVTP
ncbi:MAG: hypothetical protein H7267_14245 [Sandarakinorhabdus sp.]|nr:hypothetical protein [Sandarakinorhabdus sp.]